MNTDRCASRIIHQDKVDLARTQTLPPQILEKISSFFKACGDPGRLQILHALQQQEMCVCDLAALLKISESSVSHHLRLLRTMGLVVNRRDGTVLYYRSVDGRLLQLIDLAGELLVSK